LPRRFATCGAPSSRRAQKLRKLADEWLEVSSHDPRSSLACAVRFQTAMLARVERSGTPAGCCSGRLSDEWGWRPSQSDLSWVTSPSVREATPMGTPPPASRYLRREELPSVSPLSSPVALTRRTPALALGATAALPQVPSTSEAALRLAVRLAVDAGE
jgi:hypothetical protein